MVLPPGEARYAISTITLEIGAGEQEQITVDSWLALLENGFQHEENRIPRAHRFVTSWSYSASFFWSIPTRLNRLLDIWEKPAKIQGAAYTAMCLGTRSVGIGKV